MTFKISSRFSLPKEAATWAIGLLAKRGAGKTYAGCDIAEEMVHAEIPIVVIDGMGIWWGLRVAADKDGKPDYSKAGLPVVIFGGSHADIQLDPGKAHKIAEAIVQTNISVVLDISEFRKGQQLQIVTAFVEELYRLAQKYPVERHIFIEEADLWAPQKPGHEQLRCLGAFEDLVRRGGNRNLGCSMITQRSAVLNKDLLTQVDCLIILRTLAPQDKKAIQDWVQRQTEEDPRKLKEWFDSLNELPNGEAWVWHPEPPKIFKRIKFRKRQTFHATREFIRSPKASAIKLTDIPGWIEKIKRIVEPPPAAQKPKPALPSEQIAHHTAAQIIARSPSETMTAPPAPILRVANKISTSQATLQQTVASIELVKLRPTLQLPTDLTELPSAIIRVAAVLSGNPGPGNRDDKWTINAIKQHVANHAWPNDDLSEAIDELTRWEILVKLPSKTWRFNRDRIHVIDQPVEMQLS